MGVFYEMRNSKFSQGEAFVSNNMRKPVNFGAKDEVFSIAELPFFILWTALYLIMLNPYSMKNYSLITHMRGTKIDHIWVIWHTPTLNDL